MVRGITTSASGMVVDERIQQLLANNLANSETPGFKQSLAEQLAYPQQTIQTDGYSNGVTYNTLGTMGTGVLFQEGVPQFSEGTLTQTGRTLDVAIQDTTAPGTHAAVWQNGLVEITPGSGAVTVGQGGRLEMNGLPLAVVDANGQGVKGVFAVANPSFTGSDVVGTDGKPVVDANGQPSYVFADGNGQTVGTPGKGVWSAAGLLVGNADNVAAHSFYAVNFTAADGTKGMALTRDGSFSADSQNILVDSAGNPVLAVGSSGLPIDGSRIHLNPAFRGQSVFNSDGTATVDSNGQASYYVTAANGARVAGAKLGVVDATGAELQPLGQTEFQVGSSIAPNSVLSQLRPGTGLMEPGQEESSNVDVTSVMTQMMAVMANYEANQHAMQMQDTELSRAVSDVGKVNL